MRPAATITEATCLCACVFRPADRIGGRFCVVAGVRDGVLLLLLLLST